MSIDNKAEKRELPFSDTTVYYSGSIKGVPEAEPDFPWQLVQYMGTNGANVNSEHVAGRNQQERDEIRASRIGMELDEMLQDSEPWLRIRQQDNEWVDQASHMVALVNSPSLGVGMEIERAIEKPYRGLNVTPVLALIHESKLNDLSFMIRGISKSEAPNFYLKTYTSLDEAKSLIHKFLIGSLER